MCLINAQYIISPHTELLSQDLQAGAEDEQDYKAPEEGNLLYKLYSLQDLLVMVRSSVSLMHSRNVGGIQNQVYLLVYTHPPELLLQILKFKISITNCPISVLCFLPQ